MCAPRPLLIVLLCCTLTLAASSESLAASPPEGVEMVDRINAFRAARGRRPFRAASELTRSADRYASYMMSREYFGHLARIRGGRGFRTVGEVLEIHSGGAADVAGTVRRWARSPAHRALLLSRSLRYAGAGRSSGLFRGNAKTIWVAHFGAR